MMRLMSLPLIAAALLLGVAAASPEQAAEQVQSQTGGRVLSVTRSDDPQRPGYWVKVLLSDGRVRTVLVRP